MQEACRELWFSQQKLSYLISNDFRNFAFHLDPLILAKKSKRIHCRPEWEDIHLSTKCKTNLLSTPLRFFEPRIHDRYQNIH